MWHYPFSLDFVVDMTPFILSEAATKTRATEEAAAEKATTETT
jgi:hypothetical protein